MATTTTAAATDVTLSNHLLTNPAAAAWTVLSRPAARISGTNPRCKKRPIVVNPLNILYIILSSVRAKNRKKIGLQLLYLYLNDSKNIAFLSIF